MKTTGLALVLILLFAAPLSTGAQKTVKPPRIGTLSAFSPPSQPDWQQRSPFWGALRELGWIEGQNIMVERRWAEGRLDRLPALATELVQLKVDLILANAGAEIFAAKRATTTIPIVMASSLDTVEQGFVTSLARPGVNVTGVTSMASELSRKRPHGTLTGDATEPAWNGYLLTVTCPCGVVFERWVTLLDAELDLLHAASLN